MCEVDSFLVGSLFLGLDHGQVQSLFFARQLVLEVLRMDSGQGHLIHRHPFHCEQTVVGQCHLAVRNPQALRAELCAAVVSQCLSRVLSELCPLHVKLRNTSAVSNVMSPCLHFMSNIREFMSEQYNFMSEKYNFMSDTYNFVSQ